MQRPHDAGPNGGEAIEYSRQPRPIVGVVAAMNRGKRIWLLFGTRRHPTPRADQHVEQNVTRKTNPARYSLADEDVDRRLCRGAEKIGNTIGLDPIAFLRHACPIAAETRFDMDHGQPRLYSRPCAGQRCVRIATHQYCVRLLLLEHLNDAFLTNCELFSIRSRPDFEIVGRPRQANIEKLLLGQLAIVMLTGVDDHLVHAACQCRRK